ncbi:hypothetical protein KIN20_016316 [Parelaphostrongylus tenuis]|uniref:Uncharacterized protein n=1 Tax=Parelaphostrongylus tenuis TaxID=148309 RepID=A0AAD5QQM2_PARTN|nr:hypothetical protein KIN20_016316 [Parelaphostrongylus tenuis]
MTISWFLIHKTTSFKNLVSCLETAALLQWDLKVGPTTIRIRLDACLWLVGSEAGSWQTLQNYYRCVFVPYLI